MAYAPQQPWILNDTIRCNILFGNKFDEERYNATVTACALDHDFAQLPAGHDTEIVSVPNFLHQFVNWLLFELLILDLCLIIS